MSSPTEALAAAEARKDQHRQTIEALLLAGVKCPKEFWLPTSERLQAEWLQARDNAFNPVCDHAEACEAQRHSLSLLAQ